MSVDVGTTYGCWEVLEYVSQGRVKVRCACGTLSTIRANDLATRRTSMCKACAAETARKGHGQATKGKVSSEYTSYTHMIQRCTNPNNKDYPNYGGRGIKVCRVWRKSFEAFLLCMGTKPGPEYTIERKNGNADYEPENCIWANPTQQNRNRRCNVPATLDGKTRIISEWIEERGLQEEAHAIYKRINRGMSPEEALTKKVVLRQPR